MNNQEQMTDLMVDGFHKLDDNIVDLKAPRISFLKGYKDKAEPAKILYLQKLASTMNHAAKLISEERDKLVELLVLKDKQLETMEGSMSQNLMMLQSEVTRMNEQKQGFHEEVSRLNAEIRELKKVK